jgi:tRNA (cmo5U34)-methyltransferase
MRIASNWTFESAEVARNFDRHVREQLPWYDLATGAVAHIARHYIPDGGLVYDIGCSTGNIARALSGMLEQRGALIVGIDRSTKMADQYKAPGKLVIGNALLYPYQPFDLGVLFLVLQFMTAQERRQLLEKMRSKLRPGGALIIVDKVESCGGYPQTVMHRLTIAGKVSTGTSSEDIVAKELSLMGVQRPLPRGYVRKIFPGAVEFFRFGEFVGYLIAKHE